MQNVNQLVVAASEDITATAHLDQIMRNWIVDSNTATPAPNDYEFEQLEQVIRSWVMLREVDEEVYSPFAGA